MVAKGRLRQAIAAERGVDFQRLHEKKKHKAALKRKRGGNDGVTLLQAGDDDNLAEGSEAGDSDDVNIGYTQPSVALVDESDSSDSSLDGAARQPLDPSLQGRALGLDFAAEDDVDEEDDDIPVSDLEDLEEEDRADLIPHTRLTINNTSALLASIQRISIPTDSSAPFASHQSVTSSLVTAESIPDVSDDLQRELSFYSQCLEAARHGRARLRAENVPFSRPKDYFAEMVKEDAHMEKVKAKLIEEASSKKAAAEARKLRDLKKYGKQVQVAKLQERQKAKRETLDKIKVLKRKRQESGGDLATNEADMFDIGVDKELAGHATRQGSTFGSAAKGKANRKRQKKDEKYGFGGKKRHAKSGDALSSGDLSGFSSRAMKSGAAGKSSKPQRPGKSRRKAMGTHP